MRRAAVEVLAEAAIEVETGERAARLGLEAPSRVAARVGVSR